MTKSPHSPTPSDAGFLTRGGELGARIAAFDWANTSIGPIDGWPEAMKAVLAFVLRSHLPIVTLWGDDGVMIYNDGYRAFAGNRHPSLLGSAVLEGWSEVADFNANVLQKVYREGGTLSFKDQELTLVRDGTPRLLWADLEYSPAIGDDGIPIGVVAIVVETTERIAAERRATAEQARQRRMLEQMPGFVGVLTGPDHVFDYVNEAYRTISGARDLIGLSVRAAFPELEGQGYFELLDTVYRYGERHVAHGAPIRLREDDRFIDFVCEPILDETGAVGGIFVGGYDATEAYRTLAALAASEERLRLVIEGAQDHAIVTTGLAGTVETWSAGAEAIFGWTADEMIGRSIERIYTPEDRSDGVEGRACSTKRSRNASRSGRRPCATRWISRGSRFRRSAASACGRSTSRPIVSSATRASRSSTTSIPQRAPLASAAPASSPTSTRTTRSRSPGRWRAASIARAISN